MPIATHNALPGITTLSQTSEKEIQFSKVGERFYHPNIIASTAVDAGNTPTTTLRAGLIMGRITSSKLLKEWNPDGTDGSELIAGILMEDQKMLDYLGSVEVKGSSPILAAGCVKAAQLLIEGTVFTSSAAEQHARTLMKSRFVFDDDLVMKVPFWTMTRELIVTGDTTVTAAQNGTLFVVSGGTGVTFTLPTPTDGLTYEFINLDDQNMAVASAGSNDDIVFKNDTGADSLTFSTMSEKKGARLRVRYSGVVSKWFVENLSTCTVTVA